MKTGDILRRLLPAPFTIAVILTVVCFIAALFCFTPEPGTNRFFGLLQLWEGGIWDKNLMVFCVQMMLMLVLGHVLALSKPVELFLNRVVGNLVNNGARAAALVTLLTCLVSLFNWGLGLVFGAIFARKVAEMATLRKMPLCYPLIGAAGYSGLMVWHGGISGSALIKVAEPGHIRNMMAGLMTDDQINALPESLGFDQTVFGNMNITAIILLLVGLPMLMFWLAGRANSEVPNIQPLVENTPGMTEVTGAERLTHSPWLAMSFAAIIMIMIGYRIAVIEHFQLLKFFTPNNINFLLLGLGLAMHVRFSSFLRAVDSAIGGAAGILIQFPLYFGIMGLMKGSGMIQIISHFFASVSDVTTYPLLTFISAGLVNIFVPSGGGQWAVQGPVIIQAAMDMGLPLKKAIMALAYGDELTNMLQPFWALPLLGITGLKAKDIIPWSLLLMLAGIIIFTLVLLIF